MNAEARARLPQEKLATVGQIDLFLLEEMVVKSGHKDISYVSDMVDGFPVTGAIPSGGCGRAVPGGQRVHGKPGLGGPDPIQELKDACRRTNIATIQAAKARTPSTKQDQQLIQETWENPAGRRAGIRRYAERAGYS